MTHHAGPADKRARQPMTTGRLAVWLTFYAFMGIMVMGTVLTLAGKGQ
jgi:hypothetical protein